MDVSVVITAHREGPLAGPGIQSAGKAMELAEAAGIRCETICVLDRADRCTIATLEQFFRREARYLYTDEGDPGCARNRGIEICRARYATFLDADDLWSSNWIVEAYRFAEARPDAIAHSACNIFFGKSRDVWWHADSEGELCDLEYLRWMNYWDALAFARTDLLKRFPFRRNRLDLGYGHEDWYWNMETLRAGVPHKPVPGTIHFKRRRDGSQSELVERRKGVPWPLDLAEPVEVHS